MEKDHVLEPFTLMAHQPNYILAGAHNTVGYAPDLYREQYDNPDITSYLGHYEFRGAYKWNEHVLSVMSRNNVESGLHKGAVEVSWSFPLWGYPYVKGSVQYSPDTAKD